MSALDALLKATASKWCAECGDPCEVINGESACCSDNLKDEPYGYRPEWDMPDEPIDYRDADADDAGESGERVGMRSQR